MRFSCFTSFSSVCDTDQTRQKHLDIHDILFFLFRYSTLFCFHKFVHVILHSYSSLILSLHPSESEGHSVMSDSLRSHGMSMEFSRPEQWSRQPFPSPRDLPNPGIEPRFPLCRQIPYQLSHKGSLRVLEWVAYPFSSGASPPRNQTGVFCIAGRFFTN